MLHCYFLDEVHVLMGIHQNLETGNIDMFRAMAKWL